MSYLTSELLSELEVLKLNKDNYNKDTKQVINSIKDSISLIKEKIHNKNNNIELNNDEISSNSITSHDVNSVISILESIESSNYNKKYNQLANLYYNQLTKYSKSVSNIFEDDKLTYIPKEIPNKPEFIKLIIKELYRKGNFLTGDVLIDESNIDDIDSIQMLKDYRIKYMNYNIIINDLKKNSISQLENWIHNNYSQLNSMNSNMYFDILLIKFIHFITISEVITIDTIEKGKEIFIDNRFKEDLMKNDTYKLIISKAITYSLIIKTSFQNNIYYYRNIISTYSDFTINTLITRITQDFTKFYCYINKIPIKSSLLTVLIAGFISLPQIMKAESILNININQSESTVPYEVILPNQLKYHSIFICPVTKEILDLDNPPMLLTCGHVISKNALTKMGKSQNNKIKCPTCPNIQNVNECLELKIFEDENIDDNDI